MKTSTQFFKLTGANLKRLRKQLPAILAVSLVLFACLAFAGKLISERMYSSESRDPFGVAFYIPESEDYGYNELVINMLQNVDSVKQTITLVRVDTREEGEAMLADKRAQFFVLIPDGFFRGLLTGEVPPIDILVNDKSSIISYIANELFTAYSKYLSVDVTATYSVNEAAKQLDMEDDARRSYLEKLDLTYLDRALNKDAYIKTKNPTNEGVYTLLEHYTGVALLLTASFIGFFLIAMLHGMNAGMKNKLSLVGIKRGHLILSDTLTCLIAFYVGSLPCLIGIAFYNHHINPMGLLWMLPPLLCFSLITAIVVAFSSGAFSGGLAYFAIVMTITYIGGGVLPQALLPSAVRTIAPFFPGQYMIKFFCKAVFGGM